MSQASNDDVSLTSETLARLEPYSWAGNIHELENLMEQIALLSRKPLLDADDVEAYCPNVADRNVLPSFALTSDRATHRKAATGMWERCCQSCCGRARASVCSHWRVRSESASRSVDEEQW
ncbi:hypothetical protein [Burkholderia sp. PAMC 26561]|uniref:hypothetical protein n=1 Tax=Burkholderiaceae TaxID=119060 RepID=UPI003FA4976E